MCTERTIAVATLILLAYVVGTVSGAVIYVDADAVGANDGSSWADAFVHLQDALAIAADEDEIRVAQGTYKPDQGGGNTLGDREASFQLKNDVSLVGGYAGPGTVDPDARDPNEFETILSGDLLGNDVIVVDPFELIDHPSRTDNSLHVVVGHDTDETAVLDGFTVTSGNCDELVYQDPVYTDAWGGVGAGMYIVTGSPTVQDCTFRENSVGSDLKQRMGWGAGVTNIDNSHPLFIRCRFIHNTVSGYGTGLFASGAIGMFNTEKCNPTLLYCRFINNTSGGIAGSGVMVNQWGCSPTLLHCEFRENQVYQVGAIANFDPGTNPMISHCTFINNRATFVCGVMWNTYGAKPTITHCLFQGNSSDNMNAVIWNYQSNTTIENCIFKDNWAKQGACVWNGECDNPTIKNCLFVGNVFEGVEWRHGSGILNRESSPTVQNCIFIKNKAKNGGGIYNKDNSNPTIINCSFGDNIATNQGGAINSQNDGSGVSMINSILWSNTAPDGPQIYGSATVTYSDIEGGWSGVGNIDADPYFADPDNGDYHLMSPAGRWDPNESVWVNDPNTSPCVDAGDPASPIGLEPFPHGGRTNMGVHGGTAEASKSYFGTEPCQTIVAGDINGDCKVDMVDMAIMCIHWLEDER